MLRHEWPAEVGCVLDLTCEFSAKLPHDRAIEYHSFPILDAYGPRPEKVAEFVNLLRRLPPDQTVYIHCANGHGRTGMTATLLLMVQRGLDWELAWQTVKQCRRGVGLSSDQKRSLRIAAELLQAPTAP